MGPFALVTVPIYEGYAIPHAIQSIHFAGRDLLIKFTDRLSFNSTQRFSILVEDHHRHHHRVLHLFHRLRLHLHRQHHLHHLLIADHHRHQQL